MSRFKKYSFWVALMSAVVLLVESLSSVFGFDFNKTIFENVFLSVCGILVVLGIIVNDKKETKDEFSDLNEEDKSQDLSENKDSENADESNKTEE